MLALIDQISIITLSFSDSFFLWLVVNISKQFLLPHTLAWHRSTRRSLRTKCDAFTKSIRDAFRSLPCPASRGALASWRRVEASASALRHRFYLLLCLLDVQGKEY